MEFDFSRNHFELLGLEVKFSTNLELLEENYQQLQMQYHPDRFVDCEDQEKRVAMQATTFINEAYKVLHEPHTRARYLLELQGVSFDAEKDTTQDMDFLMAQMALREEIDEVDQQQEPLDRLDELASQSRQQKNELMKNFQAHYDLQNWEQAKEAVLKMQFFDRLQQQIDAKQEVLEDELI